MLTDILTIKHIHTKIEAEHGEKDLAKYCLYRFAELKELLETHHIQDKALFREYQVLGQWLIQVVDESLPTDCDPS